MSYSSTLDGERVVTSESNIKEHSAAILRQGGRLLRTVRYFPPQALWHRLRLTIARRLDRPSHPPAALYAQWQASASAILRQLPMDFLSWELAHHPQSRQRMDLLAHQLLTRRQGEILNETFPLADNLADLQQNLPVKSALWRENYNYLEFLLPLALQIEANSSTNRVQTAETSLLTAQLHLFRQLSRHTQNWSTYGVSRRVLACCRMLPVLDRFPEAFQTDFLRALYQDAAYIARFPELDIRGNHLALNCKAWLAATLVFEKLPCTQTIADRWWQKLSGLLPEVFEAQVLPDGFHAERTPMYHAWVLRDLLDCLSWLKAFKPAFDTNALRETARRMTQALAALRHSSGELPLLGDTSLPQTPNPAALLAYARHVLDGEATARRQSPAQSLGGQLSHQFPQAGFTVFRLREPEASLIFDGGDFGPKALPAHSHCDIGSFELHVGDQPVIVDSGVADYAPSLSREYFRGTGAHNTLWAPDTEQAECWGSFRVAAHPRLHSGKSPASANAFDAYAPSASVDYESFNASYRHQRSIETIENRFWLIREKVGALSPAERACFSLLHIHPDCRIDYNHDIFRIGEHLLIVPFGFRALEWTRESPWRSNLNLYSPGFSQTRTGQLIAMAPTMASVPRGPAFPGKSQPFGWALIPLQSGRSASVSRTTDGLSLQEDGKTLVFNWADPSPGAPPPALTSDPRAAGESPSTVR